MGVFCVVCESVVPGDIAAFQKHLAKRCHLPPFACAEGDCDGRLFAEIKSLTRHLRQKHSHSLHADPGDQEDEIGHAGGSGDQENTSGHVGGSGEEVVPCNQSGDEDNDDQDVEENETTANDDQDLEENESILSAVSQKFKRYIAMMILNLRKKGITGIAIEAMLNETSKVLKDVVGVIKEEVVKTLEGAGVQKEIVEQTAVAFCFDDPCAKLKTKKQQMAYFKANFGLVMSSTQFMNSFRYDPRLEPGTSKTYESQIPRTYEYISVIETLTTILNNPLFFKMIHGEKASSDGRMRSFLDGNLAQKNELIKKYPHTIRIVKYADEFECVNGLGAKTRIHQIMGLYWLIQNLPPEENARLRSIHVAAYGYTVDFDEVLGIDSMLIKFYEELKRLESEEGVLIYVNGEPYILRATLIAVAADTKAAHELMGLMPASANLFCRLCTVTRRQLHDNILSMGEKRTNDLHFDHIAYVEAGGKKAQKETGVVRDCLLRNSCRFAQVPQMAVLDGMHDILKGVANMEIKLALREFIVHRKFISENLFNARLQSFDLGFLDSSNRPSRNFSYESLRKMEGSNLVQTASQTWCLLRIFPFIVTPEVPAENEHLQLVVLLKRATEIMFSVNVSEQTDLQLLEKLIEEHHLLFFKLYPPHGQHTIVEEEELEEEEDEADVDDVDEQMELDLPEVAVEGQAAQGKKKKKPRIIRPINKHHHLLHVADLIRAYGPAILYWCMRFEGKHAIAVRYAQICCNFKHLDLTLAHMHQMHHCAELLEASTAVHDQVKFSFGTLLTASQCGHYRCLQDLGLKEDSLIKLVKGATQGGFQYRAGLFVTLPHCQQNSLPIYGCVLKVVQFEQEIILVTEDYDTLQYDKLYGAYAVVKKQGNPIRAFFAKTLPADRSMCPWLRYDNNSIIYLSPRSSLADALFEDLDIAL